MDFKILYHPKVESSDIPRLGPDVALRMQRVIENRLMVDPEKYGLPLRRGLAGYRKLRVGDYRIIFRIKENEVRIIMVGHRSLVYKQVIQRVF